MRQKNLILDKYFNYNLLYYCYILIKNYQSSNIFVRDKIFNPISRNWFKRAVNLIKSNNFNYSTLITTYKKSGTKNIKLIKIRVIEFAFVILLAPYFTTVSIYNSVPYTSFVRF